MSEDRHLAILNGQAQPAEFFIEYPEMACLDGEAMNQLTRLHFAAALHNWTVKVERGVIAYRLPGYCVRITFSPPRAMSDPGRQFLKDS